jgi:hypothetical protein
LDERQHGVRRRIVNRVYCMPNVVRLEEGIDTCVNMLVNRLRQRAAANEAVDMAEWVQWCGSRPSGS